MLARRIKITIDIDFKSTKACTNFMADLTGKDSIFYYLKKPDQKMFKSKVEWEKLPITKK